jgi:hypothetical protein
MELVDTGRAALNKTGAFDCRLPKPVAPRLTELSVYDR